MTQQQASALDEFGYLELPGFMSSALLERVRAQVDQLFVEEGDQAGSEFRQEPGSRRLANLVAKGPVFEEIVSTPEILPYVEAILGPQFKLSSLSARSANPHSDSLQPLHADVGAIADERGYWVCNTLWMLDDFTLENGALRIVPGTHRLRKLPQSEIVDLKAPHPEERLITGLAGTVVVMNAHCWHGGTANRTSMHRLALHAFYCREDKPQQQYQKALIPVNTQLRFSSELRRILALDDPENDRISSTADRPSGFLR